MQSTATTFPDELLKALGEPCAGTLLVGAEDCLGVGDRLLHGDFGVAVMGVDRAVIRLVSIREDESPLPEHIELKAHVLLPLTSNPCKSDRLVARRSISSILPSKVLRVGDSVLRFSTDHGPTVLFRINDVFRLCGACTSGHIFFRVNDKLYLTYEGSDCCDCSTRLLTRYVYDLSSGTPKLVYDDRLSRKLRKRFGPGPAQ